MFLKRLITAELSNLLRINQHNSHNQRLRRRRLQYRTLAISRMPTKLNRHLPRRARRRAKRTSKLK
jgi:hypothetical protein